MLIYSIFMNAYCQIFKEIRDKADKEFNKIFSNSEVPMLEKIIEVSRYINLQTTRNYVPSDLQNNFI